MEKANISAERYDAPERRTAWRLSPGEGMRTGA